MFNPRSITVDEFDQVANELGAYNGCGEEDMRDLMIKSAISVFDNYVTDDPRGEHVYGGKLIVIAWPALSAPPTFLGVHGESDALYVIE